MELRKIKDIPSSFALAKRSMLVVTIFCFLISFGSLFWAFKTTTELREKVFILSSDGSAIMAKGMTNKKLLSYRLPEIKSHLKSFHNLFWSIDQFNYRNNLNQSFSLIGDSGKALYARLNAEGHFSKIVNQNLTQTILIDSITINDKSYPYQGSVHGKLEVKREDQQTKSTSNFKSNCVLINVARTEENPHGLLIKNYLPKIW